MTPELRFEKNEPAVVSETIDGEVVIINLDLGNYYSLQQTGAMVWELIEQSHGVEEMAAAISRSYEGEPEAIRKDLDAFLKELLDEQLIRENPGLPGGAPAPQGSAGADTARPAFQKPVLGKHTDMQDLLLLDPIHEVDDTGWPQIR